MQVLLIDVQTNIFYRITNSQETQNEREHPGALEVRQKESAYGDIKFNVICTSGFDSEEKMLNQIAIIIAAITENPINRIIFAVQQENINNLKAIFHESLSMFQQYRHITTIAIGHSKQIKKEQIMSQIQYYFSGMDLESVIFISNEYSGNEICDQILKLIDNKKFEQINLNLSNLINELNFTEFQINEEAIIVKMKDSLTVKINGSYRTFKESLRESFETYGPSELFLQLKNQAQIDLEKILNENEFFFDGLKLTSKFSLLKILKKMLDPVLNDAKTKLKLRSNDQNYESGVNEFVFLQNQKWKNQIIGGQQKLMELLQLEIAIQKLIIKISKKIDSEFKA